MNTTGHGENNYIIVSDDQEQYNKLHHVTTNNSQQTDTYNKLEHFRQHNNNGGINNRSQSKGGDYDLVHDQGIDYDADRRNENDGKRE